MVAEFNRVSGHPSQGLRLKSEGCSLGQERTAQRGFNRVIVQNGQILKENGGRNCPGENEISTRSSNFYSSPFVLNAPRKHLYVSSICELKKKAGR